MVTSMVVVTFSSTGKCKTALNTFVKLIDEEQEAIAKAEKDGNVAQRIITWRRKGDQFFHDKDQWDEQGYFTVKQVDKQLQFALTVSRNTDKQDNEVISVLHSRLTCQMLQHFIDDISTVECTPLWKTVTIGELQKLLAKR
jgi:hypothetical protein